MITALIKELERAQRKFDREGQKKET